MGKITITMDVSDEDGLSDPDHYTGLTEHGFDEIHTALSEFGDDVDIRRA